MVCLLASRYVRFLSSFLYPVFFWFCLFSLFFFPLWFYIQAGFHSIFSLVHPIFFISLLSSEHITICVDEQQISANVKKLLSFELTQWVGSALKPAPYWHPVAVSANRISSASLRPHLLRCEASRPRPARSAGAVDRCLLRTVSRWVRPAKL